MTASHATQEYSSIFPRQTCKIVQTSLNTCTTVGLEEWLLHKNSTNTILKIEFMASLIQLTMLFSLLLRQHPVPWVALPQQLEFCGDKSSSEKNAEILRKLSRFYSLLREINPICSISKPEMGDGMSQASSCFPLLVEGSVMARAFLVY